MSRLSNKMTWRHCIAVLSILWAANVSAQQNKNSYSINKLSINSKMSDISPFILPDGIAFVSNREDEMGIERYSETQEEPLYKLYFAQKTEKGFEKPLKMMGELNHHFSEGPLSFTSEGRTLYFSRSLPQEEHNKTGKKARMGIFTASYENGNCQNIQPFIYNKPDYSLAHPAVAPNGNYIIFASNQAGGFGGSDLYVSYYKENTWSKPVNLGKEINSANNEVFPFVNAEGRLFFSTDGRGGSGGLDIFYANYKNFEWGSAHNLGVPFNSASDDFGYVESHDKTNGYFCSNRDETTKDDIYQFNISSFVFSECDTLKEQDYCRTFYEERTPSSDSLPLMYEWDFGNGVKKRGLEVNHCFDKPGKYSIQLNTIDLITNQLYMNEASYEVEIPAINGLQFTLPDTLEVESIFNVDATNSSDEKVTVTQYYWDFADGTLQQGKFVHHAYKIQGDYSLRLGINCIDSISSSIYSKCVIKDIHVLPHSHFKGKKRYAYKPFYHIVDRKGNVYKIQLATSKEKLDPNSDYFREIGDVKEYYDRDIFGYTVGDFNKPELCYPELKKVREKGFKEAVVIAMKENKVVSGNDSSFYVKLPSNFHFLRVVSIHGKVLDQNGKPLRTTIHLEDLETGLPLDEFKTDSITGRYEIELPIGKAYAYCINKEGYFPFSNYIDLAKANDLAEIRSDIFLMSLSKMSKDSVPVRVNNIFFAAKDSILKTESYQELKRLSAFLKKNPTGTFVIASHTDNLGDKKAKLLLSRQRAEAIKTFLANEGVPAERIEIKTYGSTRPLTLSPKMQQINNRFEMMLLQ
jgi:outer membrane protein OmpA-like peptidoglycan-associated protein